jgi:hypothetical protein
MVVLFKQTFNQYIIKAYMVILFNFLLEYNR